MRLKSLELVKNGANVLKDTEGHISASVRLLHAERSDEIFPVLLEEIVRLGYPRAFVLSANFESCEVAPVAAIKCADAYLRKFRTSLYAADNPIINVLHKLNPQLVKRSALVPREVYCQPIIYRNQNLCWEAERQRQPECLATQNFLGKRKLGLEDQQCKTCEMRSYAAAVVVELPKKTAARSIGELGALVELANRYLARLFKIEHYYNRMRDMEDTISQMNAVMMSMADPVILTDMHFRVVMQNQAAARFFKLPDETTEGLIRAIELNNMLFSAALSSMAISGTETHRDLTLVDPNEGEELLFEAVCVPSFTHEGFHSGLRTVMRDVIYM